MALSKRSKEVLKAAFADNKAAVEFASMLDVQDTLAVKEKVKIVVPAVLDPDGKYLTLFDDAGSVIVWFSKDDSGTQPTVGGAGRFLKVVYASGNTGTQIASAMDGAIGGDAKFSASTSGTIVEVEVQVAKSIPDAVDVDSGIAVSILVQGVDAVSGVVPKMSERMKRFLKIGLCDKRAYEELVSKIEAANHLISKRTLDILKVMICDYRTYKDVVAHIGK